jgi:hypothetical protein
VEGEIVAGAEIEIGKEEGVAVVAGAVNDIVGVVEEMVVDGVADIVVYFEEMVAGVVVVETEETIATVAADFD